MVGSVELFPFMLLRTAGEALNSLQKTDLPRAAAAAAKLIYDQDKLAQVGSTITEELYAEIPKMPDPTLRRQWIAIRRSIHNQRPIPPISRHMYAALPAPVQKTVRTYIRLQHRLQKLQTEAEQLFWAELKTAKRTFATLLQETTHLQNGLLLSSATIRVSLEKYIASDPSRKATVTKKERSFMEYFSRMCTKPTPFSSFTHLAAAEFAEIGNTLVAYDDLTTTSRIQLNHNLYKYLYGLLINQEQLRRRLPILLNPTIKKLGNTYVFLTNHDNKEAFQRISATPSLDVFYTLTARASRPIVYGELVRFVHMKKYIRASIPEIVQYVDQLVSLGFFELDLGVSGIDRDWDKKLVQQLSPLANHWPLLTQVTGGLTKVRELATEYETASTKKRQGLLNEAFQTFKATCELLGATPKKLEKKELAPKEKHLQQDQIFRHTYTTAFEFEPHRLWYEDAAFRTPPRVSPRVARTLKSLGNLLARVSSFDGCQNEQERMAAFFASTYGARASVSLLQFYRDYCREEDKQSVSLATVKRQKNNEKALRLFMKNLDRQPQGGEIHFDRSAIAHLEPVRRQASFSAFFHAYKKGNSAQLVLNNTVEGSGKMFSRFLYLFDDDLTRRLQKMHDTKTGNVLFAEVTDASFFNANLHPRIMPYEILTPGGHPALPSSAQLEVGHLLVTYDKAEARLRLHHTSSGKEVRVFDLGFQSRHGRSKLYNLLCTFNIGPHHNVSALVERIYEQTKAESTAADAITVFPRIVYEKRIVLRRKTWHIPTNKLPVRARIESDWDYFLRVQQWRQELQMPDEVFIKGSYYKPLYVSFKNPFLVSIFESCIRSCNDKLQIEEMLPHSGQLDSTGDRVVEVLGQWDVGSRA